jgi:hypothetical protein
MRDVKTTFRPDQTITVSDAEYADLQRQGLLVDDGKASKKKSTQDTSDAGKAGDEK